MRMATAIKAMVSLLASHSSWLSARSRPAKLIHTVVLSSDQCLGFRTLTYSAGIASAASYMLHPRDSKAMAQVSTNDFFRTKLF